MNTFPAAVAAAFASYEGLNQSGGDQSGRNADGDPAEGAANLGQLARLLLTTGGDERITVAAETGRNRYGTTPMPAPDELWFSSSTASSISEAGFAAASAALEMALRGISGGSEAAPELAATIRKRIESCFGSEGSKAVLVGSGTEAELIVLAIARSLIGCPLINILVAPGETGRGVVMAARGEHFLATASLGGPVAAGTRIAGIDNDDVAIGIVEFRASDGRPRPAGEVDRAAGEAVAEAIIAGRSVILHVLDCSKTGREGVSREAARALRRAAPDRVLVVVDACQLRSSPEKIRQDLDDGFVVLITGSKFAAGPPFSGALMLPPAIVERLAEAKTPPPAGLGTLSALADWPDELKGWSAGCLTTTTNVGLYLRWAAALSEIERCVAIPPADRDAILDRFAAEVRTRAARTLGPDALHPDDDGGTASIVSITVGTGGAAATHAATLHDALRTAGDTGASEAETAVLQRICHVGQPVVVGERAVLRVCASAPVVAEVHERMTAGANLDEAIAPLAADLDIVFAKWALATGRPAVLPEESPRGLPPVVKEGLIDPGALAKNASLDPESWKSFSETAHSALDGMIGHLSTLREQPVWRPMPEEVRGAFKAPLPAAGHDMREVVGKFDELIRPYATGNTHPMFMGWVHGAGTPAGMVAEMLAAGLNANCGGRDHVGLEVERQITRWMAEILGLPQTSSGVFVTGTSMANFLAVLVARNQALGHDVRRRGLPASGASLVAYTSAEAHGCITQAMELAGIGSDNLRLIATDNAGAIKPGHLEAAILADRSAGLAPFLVIGTAGTVNIGAIDPLRRISDVARRHRLWFHVDGAFGALAALAPSLKPALAGIELAQSIAFDFHKWGQVPYDAGFLLVRDAEVHRGTFASPAAYLSRLPHGLAAGDTWPCDLGPDLSRSFRALKTWFTLMVHGTDGLGRSIEQCCTVAKHLERAVLEDPDLEMRASVALNIVCFGLADTDSDALVPEIVMDLHARGVAAPSHTVLAGRPVIRCAIVNHRTTEADADRLVGEVKHSLGQLRARAQT